MVKAAIVSVVVGAAVVLAAAGCLAGNPAAAEEEGIVPALRIVQRTSGLPGAQQNDARKSILQTLTVDADGKRLVLEEYEETKEAEAGPEEKTLVRQVILRMEKDPPVIWEVNPATKEYREHLGDLNRYQRDRRIQELNLLQLAKRLPPKEREEIYKENHLRPDGSRVVELREEKGAVILGRECKRIVLTENGRVILDAEITTEVPGARSYYQLYRRLGVFSEEVLKKMADVKGIPLKAKITVVTALPTYVLEVEVRELKQVGVAADFFELPKGAKKLDLGADLSCAQCGKKLDPEPDRIPSKFRTRDGKWVFFCSEACNEKYIERSLQAPGGIVPPAVSPPEPGKTGKKR